MRIELEGHLGGALLFRTMAEMLRRATEEAFDTTLREEDELGFGWMPEGVKDAAELHARDPQQFPRRRASALNGIVAIGSLTAPDLMVEMAKDEKQPTTVRITAISGVARLLPNERVQQELQPILKNAVSGNVRRSAAEVLAVHGGCSAVRAQAKREQQPERMAKAVKVCDQKK